jgi:hypothetical protein
MNILSEVEVAKLRAAYEQLERTADKEVQPWWRLARTITFVALGTALRHGELLVT